MRNFMRLFPAAENSWRRTTQPNIEEKHKRAEYAELENAGLNYIVNNPGALYCLAENAR